jgi:hypothetical protein
VYGANLELAAQASKELTATPTSLDGTVGYFYWATAPGSVYGSGLAQVGRPDPTCGQAQIQGWNPVRFHTVHGRRACRNDPVERQILHGCEI